MADPVLGEAGRCRLCPDVLARRTEEDPPILINRATGDWIAFASRSARQFLACLDGSRSLERILDELAPGDLELRSKIRETVESLVHQGFVEIR